jgi:polygalacturonase
MRPFLLRWVRCTNVTVKDVHLAEPGAWTLNFFQTKGADIEGVTIRSRDLGMHNNDGIDLDSCENIRIRKCDIISGDDALVIKATSTTPSRNITATDCKLSTRTNAIKLGTESLGGFANITVSHCTITNTRMAGIALNEVDGGDLGNVTISDVSMDGVAAPISIRLGARLKTFRAGDQPKTAPGRLHDVTIRNVTAKNIESIGILINGVPGHPVEALTLDNIRIEVPGGGNAKDAAVQLPEKEASYPEYNMFGKTLPVSGFYARHVHGMKLTNVVTTPVKPDGRPAGYGVCGCAGCDAGGFCGQFRYAALVCMERLLTPINPCKSRNSQSEPATGSPTRAAPNCKPSRLRGRRASKFTLSGTSRIASTRSSAASRTTCGRRRMPRLRPWGGRAPTMWMRITWG